MPELTELCCKSKAIALTAFCSFPRQPSQVIGEVVGNEEFH